MYTHTHALPHTHTQTPFVIYVNNLYNANVYWLSALPLCRICFEYSVVPSLFYKWAFVRESAEKMGKWNEWRGMIFITNDNSKKNKINRNIVWGAVAMAATAAV